jgi:Tol biopolymer transport system component
VLRRAHARSLGVLLVAALAPAAGTAAAASFDSESPVDAPPHWLPPEAWVYNHWVPYDEGRLYRLLRISRADLWQQLRDDRRTVAQLARRRGWTDVDRLAAALVAPWRGRVSRARLAILRSRARRTLTQGHMAQHLFFHSLHQFAIASEAPSIFGVSDARFRALRRVHELSPITIARLGGRSPARVEAQAISVLRERIRAGVAGFAMTRRQAAILLRRQLTQLPRWLSQARYNGPPVTRRGKLVARPHDYASNPSVSADGRRVVFEAYRQRLPQALRLGEIAVLSRPTGGERGRPVSRSPAPDARGVRPSSAYNATTSGDGRLVAYESAAGNANFAKRYGRIGVLLCDLRTGRTVRVDRPSRGARGSKSAYNPVLSADGRSLAFQAVRSAGRAHVYVRDLRRGSTALASRDLPPAPAGAATSIYEPALSADGRVAAFTVATVPAAGGLRATSSRVYVRDLVAGVTRAVSPASAGFASNPALSGDGRWVAFTATEAGADQPRLLLHDLRDGTTRPVAAAPEGAVVDPQLSHDGGVVAFTAIRDGLGRVLAHDVAAGTTELVSRATGADGAEANGAAGDPSLSGDGRTVAFASEATNLSAAKPDTSRGVFVRDLAAATTTLLSAPSKTGPPAPRAVDLPPPAGAAPAATRATAAAPLITVRDNEFARGGTPRPDVTVAPGTVLRWRWGSKQSHDVTVRSGPEAFASPTKSGGGFSRRLRRRGVYRLVCSLHSPGMRMTVRVH